MKTKKREDLGCIDKLPDLSAPWRSRSSELFTRNEFNLTQKIRKRLLSAPSKGGILEDLGLYAVQHDDQSLLHNTWHTRTDPLPALQLGSSSETTLPVFVFD
jgi:hypothetical protein